MLSKNEKNRVKPAENRRKTPENAQKTGKTRILSRKIGVFRFLAVFWGIFDVFQARMGALGEHSTTFPVPLSIRLRSLSFDATRP
ncbi:MAG: hypothetical protein PHG65_12095 [Kiritimatiellae bacterium]|nr:hypothetical protein [Kiritimatiellia bacterium]